MPSKFLGTRVPSESDLAAIEGLRSNPNWADRLYAEATYENVQRSFAEDYNLRELTPPSGVSWNAFVGAEAVGEAAPPSVEPWSLTLWERSQSGQDVDPLRLGLDHPSLWAFGDEPESAVLVSQPYGLSSEALLKSVRAAQNYNLKFSVSALGSWHFPGRSLLVTFWKSAAYERVLTFRASARAVTRTGP